LWECPSSRKNDRWEEYEQDEHEQYETEYGHEGTNRNLKLEPGVLILWYVLAFDELSFLPEFYIKQCLPKWAAPLFLSTSLLPLITNATDAIDYPAHCLS
jgi:hypothetical protein